VLVIPSTIESIEPSVVFRMVFNSCPRIDLRITPRHRERFGINDARPDGGIDTQEVTDSSSVEPTTLSSGLDSPAEVPSLLVTWIVTQPNEDSY
jgi:hypothetical protein